jgi:CheY-like chemotaxis protein
VAHDFNNLLQAIKGNISVINLEPSLPEKVRSRVDQIEDAASQAADITQQLLSFSRVSDEQETVIDFNAIIGDVAEMAKKLLKNRVTITIHPDERPATVKINGVRAKQMVLNLCINAHDAMPNGGQITVTNQLVTLTPDQAERVPNKSPNDIPFLCCSIADTGTGIPPEVLQRIFEPFFTTKGPGKGTGLGLAIVHNIVSQAGGFLDVQSEVGKGTTFSIYLPVVDSGPVAPTQKKVSKSLKGTGTILVVDDLELVVDFAATFLTAVGYEVLTARSPKEALEVIAATGKKIDLLLTDYNMGEQTGEELMREVVKISPSTKLVLASGYLEAPEQERLKAEFDVEILGKPYNIRDAAELIGRLLGKPQA